MEEVIRSIASIDKKATDILRETEEYLSLKERDIKEKIEAMRSEIMDKTKSEAKALYEATIKEAEAEAEEIRRKTEMECNRIGDRFLRIKEKLESQLFSRIFN